MELFECKTECQARFEKISENGREQLSKSFHAMMQLGQVKHERADRYPEAIVFRFGFVDVSCDFDEAEKIGATRFQSWHKLLLIITLPNKEELECRILGFDNATGSEGDHVSFDVISTRGGDSVFEFWRIT